MLKAATFSKDRKYRYSLLRVWDEVSPILNFIGLNPSKADEENDDKTISNCIAIAMKNGYGGIRMLNLFAIVSTDPKLLLTCEDPLGKNDDHIFEYLCSDEEYVFCWGAFKEARERANFMIEKFTNALCLGQNIDGSPKHPCRLSHETPIVDFDNTKGLVI
ncbi:MAG: DUF1643 domain-containing protein [Chitinophagales bacterium]